MKRMLTLIAGGRGDVHHAVFHEFAEELARVIRRRRWTARVRAVDV